MNIRNRYVAIGAVVTVGLGAVLGNLFTEAATERTVSHATVVSGDTYAKIATRLCPQASAAMNTDLRNSNGTPSLTVGRVLHYHPDVCVAPATTTTLAPTTTLATTTTASTTTTTMVMPPPTTTTTLATTTTGATTTTTQPSNAAFFEDFTGDTIIDFTNRFDWSVIDLDRKTTPWIGQHDMACEGPDTERELIHAPISNTDPGVEFWLCGPGGPSTDHLMTSNGSDGTFGITAFSPKPSFTSNRVCWDVNLTESPGARRWWEVQLLPAAAVANEKALADGGGKGEGMVGGVDFERGTAFLGWGQGVDGTFMKRPIPDNGLIFDFTVETVGVFQGKNAIVPRDFNDRYVTQDRATRAHHCWIDNGNGTMTVTQQRPGRADYVKTFPGSFPKPFRVIFADDNYNSGKDGSLSNQTFHWDNIEVGAA